jgi:hypothetical protein
VNKGISNTLLRKDLNKLKTQEFLNKMHDI